MAKSPESTVETNVHKANVDTTLPKISDFNEWDASSYPTAGITLINIPEVEKVSVSFKYNYYTRDERTFSGGSQRAINIGSPSQVSKAIAKSSRLPRFIRLSISPSRFCENDEMLQGILDSLGKKPITSNKNLIQFEGSISSTQFSGIRLEDNQVDQSFYYSLSSSISFFNIDEDTSGRSQGDDLISHISASSVFSSNGEQIRDSLSNLQSQGVAYAPTDVRAEVSNDALRSVRFINISQNINNLVISNLIKGSIEDKTNIYEDELEASLSDAETIQGAAVSLSTPGTIKADEYRVPVSTIYEEVLPANVDTTAENNEASLPAGLYIEKFEIIQRDDSTWDRVVHEPIIINKYPKNGTNISIIDTDVKYGATYIYNVRTIALTRFEALMKDNFESVEDQFVVAVVLAGSEGTSVKIDCTENIPPEPPGNISFKYDYQNDNILLFWEEGLNPQRDVVRYQILRRKSHEVPFTLIREFDFDQSTSRVVPLEQVPKKLITKMNGPRKYYRDIEFTKDSEYIYAVASVDARGLTSNYSSQHRVSFSRGKNKIETHLVSKKGAPKPYPNLYLNGDMFVDTMSDSGHTRLRVFFDPEYYEVYESVNFGENKNKTSKGAKEETSIQSPKKRKAQKFKNSLGLLGNNYKIQIINVDRQLSKIININIVDQSGSPLNLPIVESTLSSARNIAQASADTT